MLVSEKDLFNFVFGKENLSKQKIEYIINNFLKYREKIQFLQKLFNEFTNEIPPKIWDKLISRLNNNYKKKFYILNKNNFVSKLSSNNLTLLAQSPDEEPHMNVDTFIDKSSKFLIKVITDNIMNKIYFFSDDPNGEKEFELKIYPSGKTFEIFKNSNPLIIQPKEKIENIFVIETG